MPAFTAIAAAVVTYVGATGIAAAVLTFTIKTLAVAVVSSLLLRPKNQGAGPSASSSVPGNRVQLSPNTNNKLPVVYGQAYMNGAVIDAKISSDQKYMWYVLAIAEVTDGGTVNFNDNSGNDPVAFWGDKRLEFDATDKTKVVAGTDPNGERLEYPDGEFNMYFYRDGSFNPLYGAPDAVSVLSDSNTGGGIPEDQRWSSTDTMYKTVFCIIRIKYNQDKTQTGLQTITTRVTNTLSAPGSVIADYLHNSRYGCGVPLTQINNTSLLALDAYSAQDITYITPQGNPATQPRYEINGPIDTTINCLENLYELAESCDSWLQWNEVLGQWSVIINQSYEQAGQQLSSLRTINSDNIIGGVDIVPLDTNSTYRRAEIQFPSKLINDQFDVAYLDLEDYSQIPINPNEPLNTINLRLTVVNDNVQAQYIAVRKLLQSREDLICEFSMDYSGIQIDAGDVVKITHDWYGWDEKLFRVTRVQEVLSEEGILGAKLTVAEYNDTIYSDSAIIAFLPSPNTGITNPSIFGTLSAPTISNRIPTGQVPTFQVNAVIPNMGQTIAVEFWYSTSPDIYSNNYKLYATDYYSGGAGGTTYPFGTVESTIVGGLGTGNYYWRVRMVGGLATSDFSPVSEVVEWDPNPAVTVLGQTFQVTFSPPTFAIPRTGSPLAPVFANITPSLYGLIGGGSVEFVDAQTDSASNFVNGTWRIGDSDTTGYASIVKENITIGDPTDGGTFALFPTPTAMPANPAFIRVPVRYKGNDGTVYQSAPAALEFVYQDPGANGSAGTNGVSIYTQRVYFNAPVGAAVSIFGGTWNLTTNTWQTRPATLVNGVLVTNSDTPTSVVEGSYRYVAQALPFTTTTPSGTYNPTWTPAQIDAGFGPKGNDGTNPIDISLNVSSAGFYRNSSGAYSPNTILVSVNIQNYPAPIPTPTWTVVGGTPLTSTGNSVTVTPTSITTVSVTCQVGAYRKVLVIPVVSQGAVGPTGPAGIPGSQGPRGFIPLAYVPTNSNPNSLTNSQLTAAFSSASGAGVAPIAGDGAAFYFGTITRAAKYNGSVWFDVSTFIPGSLIVENSIRSSSLAVNDLYSLNFVSTNATNTFGQYLAITNNSVAITAYKDDTQFTLTGNATNIFPAFSTVYFSNNIQTLGVKVTSSVYNAGTNTTTIVAFSPLEYDLVVGTATYASTPGFWFNGVSGDAHMNGNVHIGRNLFVDGLINNGVITANAINTEALQFNSVTNSQTFVDDPAVNQITYNNNNPNWANNTRGTGVSGVLTTETDSSSGSRIEIDFLTYVRSVPNASATLSIQNNQANSGLIEIWKTGGNSYYAQNYTSVSCSLIYRNTINNTYTRTAFASSNSGAVYYFNGSTWTQQTLPVSLVSQRWTAVESVAGNTSGIDVVSAAVYTATPDANNKYPMAWTDLESRSSVSWIGGSSSQAFRSISPVNGITLLPGLPQAGLLIGPSGTIRTVFTESGVPDTFYYNSYAQTSGTIENLNSVDVNTNPSTGFQSGGGAGTFTYTIIVVGNNGTIVRGQRSSSSNVDVVTTFALQTSNTFNSLRDVTSTYNKNIRYYNASSVVLSNTWAAVGDNGTIVYSNNNGTTWYAATSGTTSNLHGIANDYNGNSLMVAVGENGTILTSTNDGRNWFAVSQTTTTRHLWSVDGHLNGNFYIGSQDAMYVYTPSTNTFQTIFENSPTVSGNLTRLWYSGSFDNPQQTGTTPAAAQIQNGQVISGKVIDTNFTEGQSVRYYVVLGNNTGDPNVRVYTGGPSMTVTEIKR